MATTLMLSLLMMILNGILHTMLLSYYNPKNRIQMIDLGNAEYIDRMIVNFRESISEDDDYRRNQSSDSRDIVALTSDKTHDLVRKTWAMSCMIVGKSSEMRYK